MTELLSSSCPKCGADLVSAREARRGEELRFCPSCQFPVLLVAGKYELQSILGRGGFGTVYLARHNRLKRDAERVVKIISPEIFAIPGMHERFEREVQLTSILSQQDEHIVRIYDDFGELPELGHFYVMEYLQGTPLEAYLQDRNELPPLDFCYHLFRQLCQAMHNAHSEGVLHRDLKPDNLFVVRRKEDENFLKVLDFGIARPMNQEDLTQTGLTQGALGTPFYMSPEQCLNEPVDARTDIYSMGVILYKMLTGQTPFEGDGVEESNSVVRVLMRMMSDEPPPPSSIRPDRVSPPMEALVLKALAKQPEDRFQSALELRHALDGIVGHASGAIPVGDMTLPTGQPLPYFEQVTTPPPEARARRERRTGDSSSQRTHAHRRQEIPESRRTVVREGKTSSGGLRVLGAFVLLLFLLGSTGAGMVYLGFDPFSLFADDPPDAAVQADAGSTPVRVVKKPDRKLVIPERRVQVRKPVPRPDARAIPEPRPEVQRKPDRRALKVIKKPQTARCPLVQKMQCFPGWVAYREKYRFKGLKCQRWNCRRKKFRATCPTMRRIRCRSGYSSIREYYTYKGLRCLRWSCKRQLVRCPVPRKEYCLGSSPVKRWYRYRGRNCYNWACSD